ncbi:MAG TPA: histone deacetylase [Methylomirabilota bacterium]|nr:histone deacetylase [Methylomirabilota bacterium]
MKVITDERCAEYSSPGHPERPQRITRTLAKLKEQKEVAIEWDKPAAVDELILTRAHDPALIRSVKAAAADFDGDTPAHKNIYDHALRGVGGALRALAIARKGETAFSLLRPPGHHATKSRAMGFCYLSSVAVAALEALSEGVRRVAVFDFDVHHGNGTEDILLNHPHAQFTSVHQHPCYPGTGTGHIGDNCRNYPLAPQTPRKEYRATLERALEELKRGHPDMIIVSAGFDAYRGDPIAQETLEAEDFHWMGQRLHKSGIPFFSVLEGGYSDDLPELILAYLKGVSGK